VSDRSFINVARFQNKVRALFGVDRNEVPTLAELLPVLSLEDDRPEWGFAGNEFRFMVRDTAGLTAGGVGNPSIYALLNPTNSGQIAVVEAIAVSVPVEFSFTLEATILATFTAGSSPQPRDFRQRTAAGGAQLSALQAFTRNNAAGFGGMGYRLNNALSIPPLPIIIPPGTACLMQAVTANAAMEASYAWRERALESGLIG
jgi:hypothetical protein